MIPMMAIIYGVGAFLKGTAKIRFDKLALTSLSLFLLYLASAETLAIFLFVVITAYVGCRLGQKWGEAHRRMLLIVLIPLLLLPLLYYKYANFVVAEVAGYEWNTLRDLVIPIGISFYTFQTISFCLDTLRNNQQVPPFIDYINFCSFFPQIVAGPIERKSNLLPQMEQLNLRLSASHLSQGIPYVILGLFFKMALADNIALGMHPGYSGHNAFVVWMNNVIFGFRIYFDFAGYGLTAYGIAKCLGINITLNFLSPYTSGNISDFWRNWHISLTQWFRDYIYFAMGGSRTRFWWFNIICMFLISGIWHGAGWNFIIWGTLGGVCMVVHRHFKKLKIQLPHVLGCIMTFVTMMFIWMFFYETDMSIVSKNVMTVFSFERYNFSDYMHILKCTPTRSAYSFAFTCLSFLVILLEYVSLKKNSNPYSIFLSPVAGMVMVILICMFHSVQQSQFIYFAF